MCTYQVDELGYGASMAAIHQEPLVADLLISLAAQAAGNPNSKHRQRFFACPYPPSDFVCATKRASNTSGPDDNMGIEWAELKQVSRHYSRQMLLPVHMQVHARAFE